SGVSAIFVVVAIVGFVSTREDRASLTWPSVEGIVRTSTIEYTGDGQPTPRVTYAYVVKGVAYTSDRYAPSSGMSRADAKQVVAAHTPGARVTVYYNPTSPAQAVLVPGYNTSQVFLYR